MKTTQQRFEEKVDRIPIGGCHLWTGAVNQYGYGNVTVNKKTEKAHRLAWMLYRGIIPAGAVVCHKCDNPGCVNPDHLFVGTQQENLVDMHSKGRHVMRDKSWCERRRSYAGSENPNWKHGKYV